MEESDHHGLNEILHPRMGQRTTLWDKGCKSVTGAMCSMVGLTTVKAEYRHADTHVASERRAQSFRSNCPVSHGLAFKQVFAPLRFDE
jgi:hypothetical protein